MSEQRDTAEDLLDELIRDLIDAYDVNQAGFYARSIEEQRSARTALVAHFNDCRAALAAAEETIARERADWESGNRVPASRLDAWGKAADTAKAERDAALTRAERAEAAVLAVDENNSARLHNEPEDALNAIWKICVPLVAEIRARREQP